MIYPDKSDIRRSLTGYAVSMGVWLVSAALLILAASLIVFSSDDPDAAIRIPSLAALYVSLFIAGICSAAAGKRITSVIFTSLTLCAVVLLAASFRPEGTGSYNAVVSALLYVSVPVCSFIGGVLTLFIQKSKNSKPKKKNRRRR